MTTVNTTLTTTPPDSDLLRQHLAGDPAAIDRLIRRHIDMVYVTARRQAGEARADDVTQAAFLLLLRKAPSLAMRESLAGWLYRVVGYCAANLRKAEARRHLHEREAAMSEAATTPAPEQRELIGILDVALAQLKESDREAVLLHHLQQKNYAETGQQLGISEEAARKRSDRGVERLRLFFARKGYMASAATVAGVLATQAASTAPAAVVSTTLGLAHGALVPAGIAGLAKTISTLLWWTPAKVVAAAVVIALALGTAAMPLYRSLQAPGRGLPVIAPAVAVPVPPALPEPLPPEVVDVSHLAAFATLPYTHVTVDFDSASPAEAARVLGQAMSGEVNLDVSGLTAAGGALGPLTMHQHDVPWLQAALQFARITQSYPVELTAGRLSYRAALLDAANSQPHLGLWSVAGPFAVELAAIEKNVTRGMASGNDTVLTLNLFAEPALRVLKYPDGVALETFVDDKGQGIELAHPRPMGSRLLLPLTLPTAPGRRIATFRGTATYVLPDKGQYVETESPDQAVTKPVGDLDIELLPMTSATNVNATIPHFDMKVRYRRARMEAAAWAELIPAFRLVPPTVYDGAGHELRSNFLSGSQVMEGADAVVLTFMSGGVSPNAPAGAFTNGNPHHYRLEVPLGVRNVPVPFKFSNITLP